MTTFFILKINLNLSITITQTLQMTVLSEINPKLTPVMDKPRIVISEFLYNKNIRNLFKQHEIPDILLRKIQE